MPYSVEEEEEAGKDVSSMAAPASEEDLASADVSVDCWRRGLEPIVLNEKKFNSLWLKKSYKKLYLESLGCSHCVDLVLWLI